MKKNLLIIAGEISGDMHAARVIERLREMMPEVQCWGVGGDALRAAGVDLLYDTRDMAVLGVWEVLKRYGFFRRVFHHLIREMEQRKPDAVLLVDYPGFNLRFARQAHQRQFKVLYYICPQVWAWHRSRIDKMAQIVNRLMVIFPFEVDVFKHTALRVDFVGHPLVDRTRAVLAAPRVDLPWPGDPAARVALLPGSRRQEVERILPVMLQTADQLAERNPAISFLIAAPSDRVAEWVKAVMDVHHSSGARITCVTGQTREVLRQARAAMVASGTATIETALMKCPMIVVYKTAPLTYWLGKRLIRVPYLGMVNIVAEKQCCPEFLQHEAVPDNMAMAVEPLIGDTPERATMMADLESVAAALGEENPVERAAQILMEELRVGA